MKKETGNKNFQSPFHFKKVKTNTRFYCIEQIKIGYKCQSRLPQAGGLTTLCEPSAGFQKINLNHPLAAVICGYARAQSIHSLQNRSKYARDSANRTDFVLAPSIWLLAACKFRNKVNRDCSVSGLQTSVVVSAHPFLRLAIFARDI